MKKGETVPYDVLFPLKTETGKLSFRAYSSNWKDDFDTPELKFEWNFIRTPKEKWYNINNGSLTINARPISIDEVGNPSFIGRRLQHEKAEFSTSVSLQMGNAKRKQKEMEAGIVAFQNEESFYKLVVEQVNNKYYLIVASANEEFARTELSKYKSGQKINLKMQLLSNKFICFYSFDDTNWEEVGGVLDGKYLSTKVAGGHIGAYLGLYTYAKSPATAKFDWAKYKEIK